MSKVTRLYVQLSKSMVKIITFQLKKSARIYYWKRMTLINDKWLKFKVRVKSIKKRSWPFDSQVPVTMVLSIHVVSCLKIRCDLGDHFVYHTSLGHHIYRCSKIYLVKTSKVFKQGHLVELKFWRCEFKGLSDQRVCCDLHTKPFGQWCFVYIRCYFLCFIEQPIEG